MIPLADHGCDGISTQDQVEHDVDVARPILRIAQKKGWLGRVYFGMQIQTTSVLGYLRFLALAKMRGLRPYGIRYKEEQAQIESWLGFSRFAGERKLAS